MSERQAHVIYDLLVAACGASEFWRLSFINEFVNCDCDEYRCCEALGSGGKFYRETSRWRVGCYREDETPERRVKIAMVNRVLAYMYAKD